MGGRVTLNDVARAVGVSHQLVSKALNGGQGTVQVAAATAERIRQAAAELGYRPHAGARTLRRGRTGTIGLLLETRSGGSHLPPKLLEGLVARLGERGQHLTLGRYREDELHADRMPQLLRELRVDAVLVNFVSQQHQALQALLERLEVPALWINHDLPRGCVRPDDRGMLRELVAAALARGRRRIAYFHFNYHRHAGHYSHRERLDGYREGMRAAGLEPDELLLGLAAEDLPAMVAAFAERLQRQRPDAVLAYGDHELDVLERLVLPRLGLRPGRDLLLAAADLDARSSLGPRLGMRIPWAELGRHAADGILDRLERPYDPEPASLALPGILTEHDPSALLASVPPAVAGDPA